MCKQIPSHMPRRSHLSQRKRDTLAPRIDARISASEWNPEWVWIGLWLVCRADGQTKRTVWRVLEQWASKQCTWIFMCAHRTGSIETIDIKCQTNKHTFTFSHIMHNTRFHLRKRDRWFSIRTSSIFGTAFRTLPVRLVYNFPIFVVRLCVCMSSNNVYYYVRRATSLNANPPHAHLCLQSSYRSSFSLPATSIHATHASFLLISVWRMYVWILHASIEAKCTVVLPSSASKTHHQQHHTWWWWCCCRAFYCATEFFVHSITQWFDWELCTGIHFKCVCMLWAQEPCFSAWFLVQQRGTQHRKTKRQDVRFRMAYNLSRCTDAVKLLQFQHHIIKEILRHDSYHKNAW